MATRAHAFNGPRSWAQIPTSIPGIIVAVGVPSSIPGLDGIMNSNDAVNWSNVIPKINATFKGVCYSPDLGLYVAVGTNKIYTSTDGGTWTQRTNVAGSNAWTSVCWSSALGLFCAVANLATGNGNIMTSADGITWSLSTNPTNNDDWADVCWDAGSAQFCAVGNTHNRSMVSSDGINWTSAATTGGRVPWSVASDGAGQFVMGTETQLMHSTDGLNWTVSASSLNVAGVWHGVCWSPDLGLFVAVEQFETGTIQTQTSSDGITWSHTACASGSWNRVYWSATLQLFIAVGDPGAVSGATDTVMTSPDGTTWTGYVTNGANVPNNGAFNGVAGP